MSTDSKENRLKIGIISINAYSKNLNFACPLHSYVFQQFLAQHGIESTIIDYKPNYDHGFNSVHPYAHYRREYRKWNRKLQSAKTDREKREAEKQAEKYEMYRDGIRGLGKKRRIRYQKFQDFISTNYIRTKTCYDTAMLEVADPGFDCYICATDVIWKCPPEDGFDLGFLLASTCMENKHKIAYAASRGVPRSYTQKETEAFFHYLEDMDHISVREKSLQEYIEDNSDLKAQVVLDPVLLEDAGFYENILVRPPEEDYVLLYYVMEKARNTIREAAAYAREHHKKIVEITDIPLKDGRLGEYGDLDRVYRYEIGIEEWIGYIRYADCVFTNSFHAACLSIIFEKKFWVGFRMGDKISNLLSMLSLKDRRLRRKETPGGLDDRPIDYGKTRRQLEKRRKESEDFLFQAIDEAESGQKVPRSYDSWKKSLTFPYTCTSGKISGRIILNDGNCSLPESPPENCDGWVLRIRIVDSWFYCKRDGSLIPLEAFAKENYNLAGRVFLALTLCLKKPARLERLSGHRMFIRRDSGIWREYLFRPGDQIPFLPVGQIDKMSADRLCRAKNS